MIIVSQDKNSVVNYDNVEIIGIDRNNKKQIACGFAEGSMSLGEYATEERAKEVLQEIVSKYKTTLYNPKTNETVVNVPKVYEMPTK